MALVPWVTNKPYPKNVTRVNDRTKPVAQTARLRLINLFCLLDSVKSAMSLLIFLLSNRESKTRVAIIGKCQCCLDDFIKKED